MSTVWTVAADGSSDGRYGDCCMRPAAFGDCAGNYLADSVTLKKREQEKIATG